MRDIPNFDTFVKVKPIHKGWSGDKKYYVETKEGERLLLRVSDILTYEAKKHEFDIMKKMSATGMKMSFPARLYRKIFGKNILTICLRKCSTPLQWV